MLRLIFHFNDFFFALLYKLLWEIISIMLDLSSRFFITSWPQSFVLLYNKQIDMAMMLYLLEILGIANIDKTRNHQTQILL